MNRMKLGEILSVKHGWAFKGEYFAEDGEQSILTPGNFFEKGGFKPNNGKERYYTGTYPKEYLCHKGDLIVAMTQQAEGLLGSTALVPENNKYLHNQRIGLITCDEKRLNKLFAYYLFMTKSVREQLERSSSGTKVKHTSPEKIYDVEVEIPDVISQQKIANLLWAIDEKIANNNAINDNLEQQIKTIFTFQFLQNANTEWKQQSLAELSEMYQPKTISGKDLIADGNYFVYGANGIIGKYNQYNHSESEIAVACRGASCGSIQMTLPFSWITGNAMVVKPHSDFPYREYLYYYLLAKNPNYLCSGSAQPQLTRENLTLYSLKVPSTTELNAFESYAEKVRKIIIKNQQENIELSTLRDWLLPMLMNGQATVSD